MAEGEIKEAVNVEAPKDEEAALSNELENVQVGEKEPQEQPKEGEENGAPPEEGDENEADLDDDENEQNPAFIPKKGKYYMHDSRDDGPDEEISRKSRADGSWKHDRFDERWQRPKSKKQLVTKYGFDIRRNESQEGEEETEERAEEKEVQEPSPREEQAPPQRGGRGGMAPRARRGGRIAKAARVPQDRPEPQNREERPERYERQDRQQNRQDRPPRPPMDRPPMKPRSRDQEEEFSDEDVDNRERRAQRRPTQRRPNEEIDEGRGAERRQRPPPRTIRNVRGGRGTPPRGNFSRPNNGPPRERRFEEREREPRQDYGRDNIRYERRDYQEDRDRRNDREFENHRRGVIRGAVRGSYPSAPRSFTNNRGDQRVPSGYQQNRTTYNDQPSQRGSYSQGSGYVGRGGSSYGRGVSSRGTLRGGSNYYRGGGAPPMNRRPPTDRYNPNAPPHASNNMPRPPRQPTDAVYFDPGQQRNAPPPAPRNKNILEIAPPS